MQIAASNAFGHRDYDRCESNDLNYPSLIIKHKIISLFAPLALALPVLIYVCVPFPVSWTSQPKANLSTPARMALPSPANDSKEGNSRDAKFNDADFARHVDQLKKRLPSKEFSIIIQRPFVVIGDEPLETVKEHAENTIKWAIDKLKQDYFTKDPNEILDIWLFKDAASYEKNALLLFGEKPGTPYGYYSSAHKALIMNISTGGGTLVHELVHPFVEANFPACPPWLNEAWARYTNNAERSTAIFTGTRIGDCLDCNRRSSRGKYHHSRAFQRWTLTLSITKTRGPTTARQGTFVTTCRKKSC